MILIWKISDLISPNTISVRENSLVLFRALWRRKLSYLTNELLCPDQYLFLSFASFHLKSLAGSDLCSCTLWRLTQVQNFYLIFLFYSRSSMWILFSLPRSTVDLWSLNVPMFQSFYKFCASNSNCPVPLHLILYLLASPFAQSFPNIVFSIKSTAFFPATYNLC